MKLMTAHFSTSPNVKTLGELMTAEILVNKTSLSNNSDWADFDKKIISIILGDEISSIENTENLANPVDSLKGERTMAEVYPSVTQKKAADAITRLPTGVLTLTEAKYLIRYGGKGPFGGRSSFKKRISDKFLEMERTMLPDGENLSQLRVLVVSERQLPISINHVKTLVSSNDSPGSYSTDGKTYKYVLCSSKCLRMIMNSPKIPRVSTGDCYYFVL